MTTLPAQAPDSRWSMRDARQLYVALTAAPEVAELAGLWDGRLVGRPRLRRLSVAIAALTPLRGWCAKRILGSGEVVNLVLRHGATRESVRAVATPGTSVVDGRPALVIDYSAARPPLSWVRSELRWLTPGREVLGLLMFQVAHRSLGPFPFVLALADPARLPAAGAGASTRPGRRR